MTFVYRLLSSTNQSTPQKPSDLPVGLTSQLSWMIFLGKMSDYLFSSDVWCGLLTEGLQDKHHIALSRIASYVGHIYASGWPWICISKVKSGPLLNQCPLCSLYNSDPHRGNHPDFKKSDSRRLHLDHQKVPVTTLIPNKYRQSSKSSVLVFNFEVLRQLRLPIARYCLSVKLVRVRSKVDS
jgi:hypothetical protein